MAPSSHRNNGDGGTNGGSSSSLPYCEKLKGHTSPILCMDYQIDDASHHLLLSGATDECRLWDLRTAVSKGAALCLRYPGQGDVLSVLLDGVVSSKDTPATPFAFPCHVYAAVGNRVVQHDLRHASAPILAHNEELHPSLMTSDDEINQIVLSNDGSTLAAADDTGHIQLLRRGRHEAFAAAARPPQSACHNAEALVTAVAFSPRSATQWVSGGTDCTIQLWSSARSSTGPPQRRRTLAPLTPQHHDNDNNTTSSTWCNPPMIHALAYNPMGDRIAAALGDGSVGIVEANALTWMWHVEDAHGTAGVAAVAWQNHQRLWSAGNDGRIVQWHVGNDDDDVLEGPPQCVFEMHHPVPKMNWLTSLERQQETTTMLVADTSHDITMYTLPPSG